MLDRNLELFKSTFCVATRKIIDRPGLRRCSGAIEVRNVAQHAAVMLRESGHPVRRGLSVPSLTSLNTGSPAFAGDDNCVNFAISRLDSPEVCQKLPALSNQRAQGMPGAGAPAAARGVVVSTRVSHHEYAGNTRHSPRNGFNGFLRALLGDRACLPPSSAELSSANLTPASGRQDHTTSPSASQRSRQQRHPRPSHPAPYVRDDRETPLCVGRDGEGYEVIWVS